MNDFKSVHNNILSMLEDLNEGLREITEEDQKQQTPMDNIKIKQIDHPQKLTLNLASFL